MNLVEISINNFRSIKDAVLKIEEVQGSKTFALLGINESGKTSFLKALSLIDTDDISYPVDFNDRTHGVEIMVTYVLSDEDKKALIKNLANAFQFPKSVLSRIIVNSVTIGKYFPAIVNGESEIYESIEFEETTLEDYTLVNKEIVRRNKNDESLAFDLGNFFSKHFDQYFYKISHRFVLWRSSPKYIILDKINLSQFALRPEEISVPLFNCFKLAGIDSDEINESLRGLTDIGEIANLESKLSLSTTKYVNTVWIDHPIKILFKINNGEISFLIEDKGIKHKAKTPRQRSDGFRQFISFLLTLSVENYNDELQNTTLLIDEPETHLHPPAQINLLDELIRISCNGNNNLVFFATHSNYMIDKVCLERNIRIEKNKGGNTSLKCIEKKSSTYAEVNFEVFNISTTDYHNELYGFIEENAKEKLHKLTKDKKWINAKKNQEELVSLSTYIRHSIHHPENKLNKPYTESQLRKSIETLRQIRKEVVQQ